MKKTKSNIKSNAGLSLTKGLKNKLRIIAIVSLLIFAGYSGVNATIKLGNDGTTDWSMVDTDKIRTDRITDLADETYIFNKDSMTLIATDGFRLSGNGHFLK